MTNSDRHITLSVIVPCYNVARYLADFFRCIEKQWGEHDDYEVIFVDDGSTDGASELLRSFVARDPRHRVLISQRNAGVSAARNAGIDAARGEWIGFADPDDLIADGAYAYLMDHFLCKDTDMVSFEILWVDENQSADFKPQDKPSVIWEGNSRGFGKVLFSACQCIYCKAVIEQFNIRFCASISSAEDTLFNAQLMATGLRLKHTDFNCYYYVQHHDSTTHALDIDRLRRLISNALYAADQVTALRSCGFNPQPVLIKLAYFALTHVLRSNMGVGEASQVCYRLRKTLGMPLLAKGWNQKTLRMLLYHPAILPILRIGVKLRRLFHCLFNRPNWKR